MGSRPCPQTKHSGPLSFGRAGRELGWGWGRLARPAVSAGSSQRLRGSSLHPRTPPGQLHVLATPADRDQSGATEDAAEAGIVRGRGPRQPAAALVQLSPRYPPRTVAFEKSCALGTAQSCPVLLPCPANTPPPHSPGLPMPVLPKHMKPLLGRFHSKKCC